MELVTEPYFTIFSKENELLGFFCLGKAAQVPVGHQFGVYADHEQIIDIGLGMRPDLTGKGFGYEFFSIILEDVNKKFPKHTVRLTVAAFNLRAIRLYEKCGFAKEKTVAGERADFITMSASDFSNILFEK